MKVTLNRQLLGLEDLLFGAGTVEQIRGGQTVTITKVNASNLPFGLGDETFIEVIEGYITEAEAQAQIATNAANSITSLTVVGVPGLVADATYDTLTNTITFTLPQGAQGIPGPESTVPGPQGDSITAVTSSKVGKTTTVEVYVEGALENTFTVLDGNDGTGTGDMDKATYDTTNNGIVDASETAPWSGISGKPATFPPEAHYHDDRYFTETEVQTVLPKIGFDTTNVTPPSTGQMSWNQDEKTIDVGINGVVLQMGQELMTMVRNTSGGTITQGTSCMVTGTIGASGRLTVSKMDLSTTSNYIKIIGVATEDIVNGADGFVTYFGKVRTLDTSMYTEGDMLFLSNTTPGLLTNVVPVTGVKQVVARVINVSATVGTIMVRITPVDELKVVSDSTKLSLSGGTMTGAITGLKETAVAIAASDTDLSLGNVFTKTISGTTTLTVSNVPASGTVGYVVLELTNAGSATLNWFTGVKWAGGTAPTLTTAGKDIISMYTRDGGTIWNVVSLQKDVK